MGNHLASSRPVRPWCSGQRKYMKWGKYTAWLIIIALLQQSFAWLSAFIIPGSYKQFLILLKWPLYKEKSELSHQLEIILIANIIESLFWCFLWLTHLILTLILYGKYYHYFLFTVEKVRHREFNKLSKLTWRISWREWFMLWTRQCDCKAMALSYYILLPLPVMQLVLHDGARKSSWVHNSYWTC